jgi:NAD-dependent dihydropyrimidine dehydrogenase PreA subunit
MVRRIIRIDESKCNGCGACAAACHEGAIELVDGKARLRREDYCDGLGDCLPECPTGAITFEEREAAAYDAAAVQAAKQQTEAASASQLRQWPCQIKLAPVCAPYFSGAALLLAADCTAFACASVHQDYMRGRVTLIGCPKLDGVDYSKKLAEILQNNAIESVTVLRMEVPCCGGLAAAAKKALLESGKTLPLQTVTLTINGQVREG